MFYMFYSPFFHWKGFHIHRVIFNSVKYFCLKLGTWKHPFLPSHSVCKEQPRVNSLSVFSSLFMIWPLLVQSPCLSSSNQMEQDNSCSLLIKDFKLPGKEGGPWHPLCATQHVVERCLSPLFHFPHVSRFTSMLCEYFDLFQHIILFWKMGTTQVDNQLLGCSLSKLTDPQEYQFRSAACKHGLWTSSSVSFFVFIQKNPRLITYRPNIDLPCYTGFAGSQGRCTTPQDRWLRASQSTA